MKKSSMSINKGFFQIYFTNKYETITTQKKIKNPESSSVVIIFNRFIPVGLFNFVNIFSICHNINKGLNQLSERLMSFYKFSFT